MAPEVLPENVLARTSDLIVWWSRASRRAMFVSVRRTQATCVGDDEWQCAEGGRSERSLGGEETARFNLSEAFFQREELCDFPPLPGMPEVGQVEAPVASVLKSGELGLEEG
jgi:hypothetical protein